MEALQSWGIALIRAVQALGPALDAPMRFFTSLGQEGFFVLLIPLLYWCIDRRLGARVALLLMVSNLSNGWAKWLFHQPRPGWLQPGLARDVETSYGIPSGHAQNGMAIWLYLACAVRRPWAWAVAAAMIAVVSFSRLYLGVHFPHDVVAGWVLGALCFRAFVRYGDALERRLVACSDGALVGIAAGLAAAILAVTGVILLALRGVPDPPAWASYATLARDPGGAVMMAGMLSGAVLGYGLEERHLRFDAGGPIPRRVLRFLVGLVGLAAILLGPKLLFPAAGGWAEGALRFARYFLSLLWATYGAPRLFVAWRLAGIRVAEGGVVRG